MTDMLMETEARLTTLREQRGLLMDKIWEATEYYFLEHPELKRTAENWPTFPLHRILHELDAKIRAAEMLLEDLTPRPKPVPVVWEGRIF